MTPEQFIYWLQGFVEMNPNAMLTHTQWEILKDHLKLVLNKQTPNRGLQVGPSPIYPSDIFKSPLIGDSPLVTC